MDEVTVEMTPNQFGKLLNGVSNSRGEKYQMIVHFDEGREIVYLGGIGDLEEGQEYFLRIKLVGGKGKERK